MCTLALENLIGNYSPHLVGREEWTLGLANLVLEFLNERRAHPVRVHYSGQDARRLVNVLQLLI